MFHDAHMCMYRGLKQTYTDRQTSRRHRKGNRQTVRQTACLWDKNGNLELHRQKGFWQRPSHINAFNCILKPLMCRWLNNLAYYRRFLSITLHFKCYITRKVFPAIRKLK